LWHERGTLFALLEGMETLKTSNPFIRFMLLSSLTVLGPNLSAVAAEPRTCEEAVAQGPKMLPEEAGRWRPDAGKLYSAIRANPLHYWGWVKNISNIPKSARRYLGIKGIVVGDFHAYNFNLVETVDGKRKLQLADADDSGVGYLYEDFVRGVITNRVSPYKVSTDTMMEAYVAGLKGKKMKMPEVLRKAQRKSHEDFLKNQAKKIAKLTDGNQFRADADLLRLNQADAQIMALYEAGAPKLKEALGDAEILDVGYYVKEGGGSQGAPRFWFLVSKDGAKDIIELKTMADAGVGLVQPQDNHVERFQQVVDIYRSVDEFGFYQVIDGGFVQFIARSRIKSFLDLDHKKAETKKDIEDGQLANIYMVNWVGRRHGEQDGGRTLLKIIESDTKAARKALKDFVEEAIKEFEKLHKNNPA
jgi:hypothetical protein